MWVQQAATSSVVLIRFLGDGRNPCSYCDKHDQRCKISAKRRSKNTSVDAEATAQRLARLEAILENSINTSPSIFKPQVSPVSSSRSVTNRVNSSSHFPIPPSNYTSYLIPGHNHESTGVTTSMLPHDNNPTDLPSSQGATSGD